MDARREEIEARQQELDAAKADIDSRIDELERAEPTANADEVASVRTDLDRWHEQQAQLDEAKAIWSHDQHEIDQARGELDAFQEKFDAFRGSVDRAETVIGLAVQASDLTTDVASAVRDPSKEEILQVASDLQATLEEVTEPGPTKGSTGNQSDQIAADAEQTAAHDGTWRADDTNRVDHYNDYVDTEGRLDHLSSPEPSASEDPGKSPVPVEGLLRTESSSGEDRASSEASELSHAGPEGVAEGTNAGHSGEEQNRNSGQAVEATLDLGPATQADAHASEIDERSQDADRERALGPESEMRQTSAAGDGRSLDEGSPELRLGAAESERMSISPGQEPTVTANHTNESTESPQNEAGDDPQRQPGLDHPASSVEMSPNESSQELGPTSDAASPPASGTGQNSELGPSQGQEQQADSPDATHANDGSPADTGSQNQAADHNDSQSQSQSQGP